MVWELWVKNDDNEMVKYKQSDMLHILTIEFQQLQGYGYTTEIRYTTGGNNNVDNTSSNRKKHENRRSNTGKVRRMSTQRPSNKA